MGMSVTISAARAQDAENILKLQYLCYQGEAELHGDYTIEPLTQTLDELRADLDGGHCLVARLGDEVVASVRGRIDPSGTARIGKLMVHPRMQRHGLGGRLLDAIETHFAQDPAARRFRLFTTSLGDMRLYRSRGYAPVAAGEGTVPALITLEKPAAPGTFVASA
ncbi:GNAT family N-acetyltransferase [Streptomyces fuscigenes]|uniref:GNAT family N-acetyltransferase n=1 Tax=Streptomyces fuscigenes TaxID=1528880 RepID=UPI001F3214E9|nr:GNAT family N-acetyltransferase [Streptomyces fuscigenes]MCF3964303.1 GNAT family N-acetyltransferase [Streptomyces fuscigenes]